MRKTIVFAAASVVAIIATAEVVYTYENDSKTYVATVKTAETSNKPVKKSRQRKTYNQGMPSSADAELGSFQFMTP